MFTFGISKEQKKSEMIKLLENISEAGIKLKTEISKGKPDSWCIEKIDNIQQKISILLSDDVLSKESSFFDFIIGAEDANYDEWMLEANNVRGDFISHFDPRDMWSCYLDS